jgi:hypothetical protein
MRMWVIPLSCAVAPRDDTVPGPDLSWLMVPGLLLVAAVVAAIVYFAVKGSRGR